MTEAERARWQEYLLDRCEEPDHDTGCIEWNGAKNLGYGACGFGGRRDYKVHRLSYEAFKGPIPKGLLVRHLCDNPACINPDHLELGTNADNMRDRSDAYRGKLS